MRTARKETADLQTHTRDRKDGHLHARTREFPPQKPFAHTPDLCPMHLGYKNVSVLQKNTIKRVSREELNIESWSGIGKNSIKRGPR